MVNLFIEIDSGPELYLLFPKASFRNWSISGQFCSSCANAHRISRSSGVTRSSMFGRPGALDPSVIIPMCGVSWTSVIAFCSALTKFGIHWSPSTSLCRVLLSNEYNNVFPSLMNVKILCCSCVNCKPVLPAASSSVFEGNVGWSLHKSSLSMRSSGVVGCSGVLGRVSLVCWCSISSESVSPEEVPSLAVA